MNRFSMRSQVIEAIKKCRRGFRASAPKGSAAGNFG
jgi:hypothetical protein